MPTKVLVFESDSRFADELKKGLAGFGCQTSVVDDASLGLTAAQNDKPDLILLSIELPRMNGFSVCNKLKRDAALKEVPLIIMSSDSTEETFEQHRRLRTRAEDYVHKPISFGDLVARIRQFVPLAQSGAGAAPESVEPEIEDAVEIAEEEIVESDFAAVPPAAAVPANEPEGEVIIDEEPLDAAAGGVDADVDDLTEQAFDALMEPAPPANVAVQASAPRPASIPPPRPSSAPPRPASVVPLRPASVPPRASEGPRAGDDAERFRTRVAELENELAASRAKLRDLEDAERRDSAKDVEMQRLKRELEDVKSRLASGKGAGSAREFLDLREQLNKKDKEILELRDVQTHKDKELLAVRDASLALERERADLNDRIGDLEKKLSEIQRSNDALKGDKEQAAKRADDFKRKFEKQRGELETKTSELATIEARNQAAREELEAQHRDALAKAVAETEERLRRASAAELDAANQRAADAQREALEQAQKAAEQARDRALDERTAELNREFEDKLRSHDRASDEALSKLKAGHAQAQREAEQAAAAQLASREAELAGEHQKKTREIENSHARIVEELTRDKQNTASALDAAAAERDEARRTADERQTRIDDLERSLSETRAERDDARRSADERAQRIVELEVELATRSTERDEARASAEDRAGRIAELERDVAALRSERDEARNTAEQRATRGAELEAALAERTAERDEARETAEQRAQRIAELERELEARNADKDELEQSLAARSAELGNVERALQTARAESGERGQLLEAERNKFQSARDKWIEDKASLERAKDALAAALASIEETESRQID